MANKSYLSEQIKLISLSTSDLLTDEEWGLQGEGYKYFEQMDALKENGGSEEEMSALKDKAKICFDNFRAAISSHKGPRKVRTNTLMQRKGAIFQELEIRKPELFEDVPDIYKWYDEKTGEIKIAEVKRWKGINWDLLRPSYQVSEFCSEESRAMGLKNLDITFDKIIIKWKEKDILRQICNDGFTMDIVDENGIVTTKMYHVMTASAGQLRTDKIQCLSSDVWATFGEEWKPNHINGKLMCGLTWDEINAHEKKGKFGINVNKLAAYMALSTCATDPWNEADIDKCIVIKDFEAPVTGVMDYIDAEYNIERGVREVIINHCDGIGMVRPDLCDFNFMVRAPWIKGLLTPFDWIKFCSVNNCEPVLEDYWGQKHNLIDEDIQIIFTESQFKLAAYYKSWDDYKARFKFWDCHINRMNYEESYLADKTICYQMVQTLVDFTDDEINSFINPHIEKINKLCSDPRSILRTLGAGEDKEVPYFKVLARYPNMLRDTYTNETLKDIKTRMVLDGKSVKVKCKNKRLFAIPDMYAACEHWFLGIEKPNGILKDGYVYSRLHINSGYTECAVLRSPHLYMEWTIRQLANDSAVKEWFNYGSGIYTSIHDLISRVLQFDVDGDQLNVVVEPSLVEAAKRNIKEFDIVPLFYEANKADPEIVNKESFFQGLWRAHMFSGIGQVSNNLAKLWSKVSPEMNPKAKDNYYKCAARLCKYNNQVIDAAKTAFIEGSIITKDEEGMVKNVIPFGELPKIKNAISKSTGGKTGKMPFFFQFSLNGRRKIRANGKDAVKVDNIGNGTIDRICRKFGNISSYGLNIPLSEVGLFDWKVLCPQFDAAKCKSETGKEILKHFKYRSDQMISEYKEPDETDDKHASLYDSIAKEQWLIEDWGKLLNINYDGTKESANKILEEAIHPIIYDQFHDHANSKSSKMLFWDLFGDIVLNHLNDGLAIYGNGDFIDPDISQIGACRCIKCHKWFNVEGGRRNNKFCSDCGNRFIPKGEDWHMIRCVNTGEVFNNPKEASDKYGIARNKITEVCSGKRNSAGKLGDEKLVWEYAAR